MTTDTTQNGTQGDTGVNPGPTLNPTFRSTAKPIPRSTPKSTTGERSITIDKDVAERISELAETHGRKIRAIVALGEVLARRHLADQVKLTDDEWVEQMAAR
jgi:hypothetical protein